MTSGGAFNRRLPNIAPPNETGRPRIIVPGGIGDIYWIMVKMKAFCKREGITEKPDVIIMANNGVWESSQIRALPFLKMLPFINVADPPTVPMFPRNAKTAYLQALYHRAGLEFGQSVWPGFFGYEYFICYNGLINTGHWLEVDDDLECDWFFPMTISDEQSEFEAKCRKEYGKYAVFFFSLVGDFVTKNMAQFSLNAMAESITHFVNLSGLTPVFIGAWWDYKWPTKDWPSYLPELMSKIPNVVNLVGKTTLDQAFGVMRGAEIVSGYHCGLTNMAIMFKKPTVLLWATGRFPENTPLAVAPPSTRMTSYIPLYTGGLTIEKYLGTMLNAIGRN